MPRCFDCTKPSVLYYFRQVLPASDMPHVCQYGLQPEMLPRASASAAGSREPPARVESMRDFPHSDVKYRFSRFRCRFTSARRYAFSLRDLVSDCTVLPAQRRGSPSRCPARLLETSAARPGGCLIGRWNFASSSPTGAMGPYRPNQT